MNNELVPGLDAFATAEFNRHFDEHQPNVEDIDPMTLRMIDHPYPEFYNNRLEGKFSERPYVYDKTTVSDVSSPVRLIPLGYIFDTETGRFKN